MKSFILLFLLPIVAIAQTKSHTPAEVDYINEINLLRSNPSAYVEKVKAFVSNPMVDSASRRVALEEVVPLLQSLKPMPILKSNDHGRWLLESHNGVDTSSQEVHHGDIWSKCWKKVGENLSCGSGSKASSSIIILLIDVAVPDRSHRKTILDSSYTEASVRRVVFGDESNIFQRRIWWISVFIQPK